jgi:hypothetical protein
VEPISFHPNMTTMRGDGNQIRDLPVVQVAYSDGSSSFVSCWRMTFMDVLRAIFFQRVYLSMTAPHPPVSLSTSLKGVGLHSSQTKKYEP